MSSTLHQLYTNSTPNYTNQTAAGPLTEPVAPSLKSVKSVPSQVPMVETKCFCHRNKVFLPSEQSVSTFGISRERFVVQQDSAENDLKTTRNITKGVVSKHNYTL